MRSLFLIGRHGESLLNDSKKFRGWSDGPDAQLNDNGIASAHEAAEFLLSLNQPINRIICSPLGRSQETAAIIAEYFGLTQLEVDDRLRPLNVGSLAGQSKEDNPIGPYLTNKNKRFPNGETVNEFEQRQYNFANYLLGIIEETHESILVEAHVSNCMYWVNAQNQTKRDEYLDESDDLILPGGIAMVTEHATVALFKQNIKTEIDNKVNEKAIKGEPGTGYESGAKGSFSCGNCEYFRKSNNSCGQQDMMEKSQRDRTKDGRILVEAAGCCEYVDRIGSK